MAWRIEKGELAGLTNISCADQSGYRSAGADFAMAEIVLESGELSTDKGALGRESWSCEREVPRGVDERARDIRDRDFRTNELLLGNRVNLTSEIGCRDLQAREANLAFDGRDAVRFRAARVGASCPGRLLIEAIDGSPAVLFNEFARFNSSGMPARPA